MLKEMINYSIKSGGFTLKFFHFEIASEVKVHCKTLGKTRQIKFPFGLSNVIRAFLARYFRFNLHS